MKKTEKIIRLAKKNQGIVTSSMVDGEQLSRMILKYLASTGKLIKTDRGIYVLPDAMEDDFVQLQNRFKKGIFSFSSALFLWGLTDQTPNEFHMTFPNSYNLTNPKKRGIRCHQTKESLFLVGVNPIKTPGGNEVRCYNPERTLCDLLVHKKGVDVQILSDAFKRYTASDKRNIPLLLEYANMFRVEAKVKTYLEVLL